MLWGPSERLCAVYCFLVRPGGTPDPPFERVAATGALDEARQFALRYAAEARDALDGRADRASLETLTHIVVDREG